jgi:tRNA uridine 5-carbamoylmethylation protein Kti12
MKLYLIRGVPGSGKSTLAKTIGNGILSNWTHYEADMYFERDGVYKFDMSLLGEAHEWCREQTEEDLSKGYTVIVSNTFTTTRELNPYFGIALLYGVMPTVITCNSNWGNIHNVPADTLAKMKARFQHDISHLVEAQASAIRAMNHGRERI